MKTPAPRGSSLISRALDVAASHLNVHVQAQRDYKQKTGEDLPKEFAGIVFSGNPHETVPRRLLLDDRLSPLERNAWQVFRLLMNGDGVTAFPTYDQLRPYLGNNPGRPASRETVAKALTVLRLTRWMSLGRRVRDAITGQVQGNIYILHDEPVAYSEAIQLDQDFLPLVANGLDHTNTSVREIAGMTFDEMLVSETQELPTRVEVFRERFRAQGLEDPARAAVPAAEFGIRTPVLPPMNHLSSDSELSRKSLVDEGLPPSSESELSGNQGISPLVRNPNSYSTYTNTNTDVSKSSVLRGQADGELVWPTAYQRMSSEQQQRAQQAILSINPELRAPVVKQWGARCASGKVGKPFAYLLSLIQKAQTGGFNAEWQPGTTTQATSSQPTPTVPALLKVPRFEPAAVQPTPTVGNAQTGRDALRGIRKSMGRGGAE
ncbi:STY4528 family pathogenicity island replication protein [Pseudomonas oryzihabitans]|uniref:STY4528 family pathogenicity island replication protein n=1 Tax=Pseudomonas oryzihabitans TaxID=47885 RepID=UPI002893AFBE|nr:STY4528 family pathogenicity island replication protein [Pseudomonas oryzihabitans]MDT3722961.1 STY4528 family pathogenicity island replication protein [Pseudomonas oryzihabitans]